MGGGPRGSTVEWLVECVGGHMDGELLVVPSGDGGSFGCRIEQCTHLPRGEGPGVVARAVRVVRLVVWVVWMVRMVR
jgi:hypothetical protein